MSRAGCDIVRSLGSPHRWHSGYRRPWCGIGRGLCVAALALASGAPGTAQPQILTRPELDEALARHVASLGGQEAIGEGDLLLSGSEEAEGRRYRTRIFVRRQPFAYREEITPLDPPGPTMVTISDGRRAWRLGEDGRGEPLPADAARTYLERGFVEGFLYLDPERNASAAGLSQLERLGDYPGLPPEFERGLSARVVNFPSPAGTTLQFYFDADGGRLHEVVSPGLEPIQWVRFGAWRRFGRLNLPSLRAIGVPGLPPMAAIRIEHAEVGPPHPDGLFQGDPVPATPPLQEAGELVVRPLSVPGSAHLELPQAEINGTAVVSAILDTGAGWTSVRPALAGALHLPFRGLKPLAAPWGVTARMCWIDSLQLGSRRMLQVVVAALPLPGLQQFHPESSPALLLGAHELLDDSPILDFEHRRLLFRGQPVFPLAQLAPADHPGTAALVVPVPFRRERGDAGAILVDVLVNGQPVPAILDTGSGPMLQLTRPALVRAGLPATRQEWLARGAVPTTGVWAGGGETNDLIVRLESFQLGPFVYRDPVVYISGLDHPDDRAADYEALLGTGSLLPFARVGIDNTRRVLELEPGEGVTQTASGLLEIQGPGTFLGLVVTSPPAAAPEGQLALPVIREVGSGTVAARADLRPGDRVLAIDGTPCAGCPVHAFGRRLWLKQGSTVELQILTRDGTRRTVRLTS